MPISILLGGNTPTVERERAATVGGQVNGKGKAALEEPGGDSQKKFFFNAIDILS